MYVTQSVAPPATRHLSGPCLDPNWEFDRGKAVRVLLQVRLGRVCDWVVLLTVDYQLSASTAGRDSTMARTGVQQSLLAAALQCIALLAAHTAQCSPCLGYLTHC